MAVVVSAELALGELPNLQKRRWLVWGNRSFGDINLKKEKSEILVEKLSHRAEPSEVANIKI